MFYTMSILQDFESFLRTEIDLVEDVIRFVLDEYNSSFITYEIEPSIYTFDDLPKALFNILQPEYEPFNNSVDIDFIDIAMKTNLVARRGIIALIFDERSFFSTILGFKPYWGYRHYNEHVSQKIVNLSTTNKKHLQCDLIDGSMVRGSRQPINFRFFIRYTSRLQSFLRTRNNSL